MLASARPVGFIPSTDLDRSREFYGGVLGLRVVSQDGFALAVDAAGLVERDVEFLRFDGLEQDEAGVWIAPGGTRVAWFRDPDGNTLSVHRGSGV